MVGACEAPASSIAVFDDREDGYAPCGTTHAHLESFPLDRAQVDSIVN